jgi:hypothetical protein
MMSKVKPNIDLSLYKIDVEDTSLGTSSFPKRKEKENISLVQLRNEFDGFSHINMVNPRHRQEIMSMFPDYLIEQANPDDMELFLSMSRFDSRNNTFVVGCFDNKLMDFQLVSYKHKMLGGVKWRTRGGTSPNGVALVRIYSDNDPIFVLEGHKDSLTAILLGLNFIMLPYAGYRNLEPVGLQEEVRDRSVVFLVEDKQAFDCMNKLAKPLSETAKSIVLKQLGDTGMKVDLSDYVQQFNSINGAYNGL